jgi:hypothetical protein
LGVLNIQAILALVAAAERDALEETADFIVRDAKARAPVRKVFREAKVFRRKFRALTTPERHLAIKRAMAYQGYTDFERRRSVSYLQHYARAEVRRQGSANALSRSRTLRNLGTETNGRFQPRTDAVRKGRGFQSASLHPLLTSRGRYEVRTGRAIHREVTDSGSVRVQVGGALKASIGNEGVVQSGNGSVVRVSARIRYAKFVEFPTTHNAAQPFLLPALHGNRGRLRSTLAGALRAKLGGQ